MAGIMLKVTRRKGVVDVYNRVTLINDLYTGNNRELNRRLGNESSAHAKGKQITEVEDAYPSGH